jgi:hypothetical protein
MKSRIASFTKSVCVVALSINLAPACAAHSPDQQDVLSPEQNQAQAEAAATAQEMSVERAIQTEREDPEWSPGAVTSWTEVFQREGTRDELKGIQMRSINCRTTLCRLELIPTDPGQGAAVFEQDLRKLILVGPWQAPGFGKIANPDGQAPVAVIYLAREGYDLP